MKATPLQDHGTYARITSAEKVNIANKVSSTYQYLYTWK